VRAEAQFSFKSLADECFLFKIVKQPSAINLIRASAEA
jgi:hypothetical protein